MNTGIGAERTSTGLRGHPGAVWEHITFKGFADGRGDDGTKPLLYRYEDADGSIKEERFGVGEALYSVKKNGTGRNHILENTSDRPILLMIDAEEKPLTRFRRPDVSTEPAAYLRERLHDLVTANRNAAPDLFTNLIRDLPRMDINRDVLEQLVLMTTPDTEFDKALTDAVLRARGTTLLYNGKPVKDWGYGRGLVLLVNERLEVLGYFDESGSDLSPRAAVAKAVTGWFLHMYGPGRDGDITDPVNVKYLGALGVKVGFDEHNPHVYSGCIPPVSLYGRDVAPQLRGMTFFFAGGHYYFTDEIKRDLIEGTETKVTDDTMAGAAEMTLAHFVALRMDGEAGVQPGPLRYEFIDEARRKKNADMIRVLS
jgi:hypothetical protein